MANELKGARIAFITSNEGIEQAELEEPWKAVEKAGARPELLAKQAGEVQAFRHLDRADKFPVDRTTKEATAADYDGLVLPGGVANGDQVRMDQAAVGLAKSLFELGKPVAVICHGGWVLIEAGVVQGRTLTSWPSLQTDYRHAGATWVDQALAVCTSGSNTLISSRKPDDLPAFNQAILEHFAKVHA